MKRSFRRPITAVAEPHRSGRTHSMKRFWLRSLALSLGLVVAGGRATAVRGEQPIARSSPSAAPAVVLERPVAITHTNPDSAGPAAPAPSAPAASLGKPLAVASTPAAGNDTVQPV